MRKYNARNQIIQYRILPVHSSSIASAYQNRYISLVVHILLNCWPRA